MRISRAVKWMGLVVLLLVVGTAIGGGIVYATTSASQDRSLAERPPAERNTTNAREAASGLLIQESEPGLLVAQVAPDGPAAAAGLVRGDILLALDGEPVNTWLELQRRLSDYKAGDQVELQVLHGDDERTLTATLGEPGEPDGRPYLGLTPCGGLPFPDAGLHLEGMVDLLPGDGGALVTRVLPDTPASAAGLQEGDRITAVDGQKLDPEHNLADLIAAHAPGDTVTLAVERPGEDARELTVELGQHPDREGAAYLGIEFAAFPHVGVDLFRDGAPGAEQGQGVILRGVDEGGPAAAAGLGEGDVVTALDGQPLASPRDLVDALAARQPGDQITLTLLDTDSGEERDVAVTLAAHPDDGAKGYLGVSIGGFFHFGRFEGELPPLGQLPFDPPLLREDLEQGVLLGQVVEDGPAAAAGLVTGDVITAIDGEPVQRPQDLLDAIAAREPGDTLSLTVQGAEGEPERAVQVTLGAHPDDAEQAYLGASIGRFTRSLRWGDLEGRPSMQPLREFMERFRERYPSGPDGGLPDRLPFDFNLPKELFEPAPAPSGDVTV